MCTNWANVEYGANMVDFSSEIIGCSAHNVLNDNLSSIWLSEEGFPQWFCVHIAETETLRNLVIRTIGWYCWHSYSTNPRKVVVHVSADGSKFKIWDTFIASNKSKKSQLFCCAPISIAIYPYIAFEVDETFGGLQTYINRIFLFNEEVLSPTSTINNGEALRDTISDTENSSQNVNKSSEYFEERKKEHSSGEEESDISQLVEKVSEALHRYNFPANRDLRDSLVLNDLANIDSSTKDENIISQLDQTETVFEEPIEVEENIEKIIPEKDISASTDGSQNKFTNYEQLAERLNLLENKFESVLEAIIKNALFKETENVNCLTSSVDGEMNEKNHVADRMSQNESKNVCNSRQTKDFDIQYPSGTDLHRSEVQVAVGKIERMIYLVLKKIAKDDRLNIKNSSENCEAIMVMNSEYCKAVAKIPERTKNCVNNTKSFDDINDLTIILEELNSKILKRTLREAQLKLLRKEKARLEKDQ